MQLHPHPRLTNSRHTGGEAYITTFSERCAGVSPMNIGYGAAQGTGLEVNGYCGRTRLLLARLHNYGGYVCL